MPSKSQLAASRKQNLVSLSPPEKSEFSRLEAIVEKSFHEGGMALMEIRDKRLYRENFHTFEDYCQSRWGFTRVRGHQVIEAAKVMAGLPAKCKALLNSPRAATELVKVPEAERPSILTRIAAHGKVTADAIKREISNPPIKKREKVFDKTGLEVPVESLELWQRGTAPDVEATEILSILHKVKRMIAAGQERNDPLFREVDYSDDLAKLSMLITDIKCAIPHAVCWVCNGKRPKTCDLCKGRGFVSEFYWKTCCPEELRNLRKGKV